MHYKLDNKNNLVFVKFISWTNNCVEKIVISKFLFFTTDLAISTIFFHDITTRKRLSKLYIKNKMYFFRTKVTTH